MPQEQPSSAGYRRAVPPLLRSGPCHPPNSASLRVASFDNILPPWVSPSSDDGILQKERHESPCPGPTRMQAVRLRDDAVPNRVEHKFGGVVQVEFLKDMRAMGLDRGRTHAQHGRDLLVAVAFRDQLKDFSLALGE